MSIYDICLYLCVFVVGNPATMAASTYSSAYYTITAPPTATTVTFTFSETYGYYTKLYAASQTCTVTVPSFHVTAVTWMYTTTSTTISVVPYSGSSMTGMHLTLSCGGYGSLSTTTLTWASGSLITQYVTYTAPAIPYTSVVISYTSSNTAMYLSPTSSTIQVIWPSWTMNVPAILYTNQQYSITATPQITTAGAMILNASSSNGTVAGGLMLFPASSIAPISFLFNTPATPGTVIIDYNGTATCCGFISPPASVLHVVLPTFVTTTPTTPEVLTPVDISNSIPPNQVYLYVNQIATIYVTPQQVTYEPVTLTIVPTPTIPIAQYTIIPSTLSWPAGSIASLAVNITLKTLIQYFNFSYVMNTAAGVQFQRPPLPVCFQSIMPDQWYAISSNHPIANSVCVGDMLANDGNIINQNGPGSTRWNFNPQVRSLSNIKIGPVTVNYETSTGLGEFSDNAGSCSGPTPNQCIVNTGQTYNGNQLQFIADINPNPLIYFWVRISGPGPLASYLVPQANWSTAVTNNRVVFSYQTNNPITPLPTAVALGSGGPPGPPGGSQIQIQVAALCNYNNNPPNNNVNIVPTIIGTGSFQQNNVRLQSNWQGWIFNVGQPVRRKCT